MRICLLTSTFLPELGGVEYLVHYLANFLNDMSEKVYVLAPSYKKDGAYFQNMLVNYKLIRYYLPPKGSKYVFNKIMMSCLLFEKIKLKFDILHAHFAYPAGFIGAKVKKILKVPLVITTHAADVQKFPELNYGMRLNPVIDKKIKFALRTANAIISVSDSVKEDTIEAGGKTEKITVIPTGVNVKNFGNKRDRSSLRNKIGFSNDENIILTVGRNHPKKAFNDLLKAVAIVKYKIPNIRCIIVGIETEKLKPLIADLHLQQNITLTGPIPNYKSKSILFDAPHPDLLAFYQISDIFALPSLIEGFPLVLPEAMAAGLPIITTDVPGNRDAVKDGVNGFLVPARNPHALAEKIITLLNNEILRKRISKNSLRMSAQYDYSVIANRHIKLYTELISKT